MFEFVQPIQTLNAAAIVPRPTLITILLALVLPSIGILIGATLARVLTPREYSVEKLDRYEAGNPPYGRARGFFPMQYYPYLIIFLTVEPVMIYLFLVLMALHESTIAVGLLFVGLSVLLALPLVFALDSARRLKYWIMREV
ncbi:hypothetical protein AKJ48_01125 [candidate division MSBL1 archaeon SCGC-AAA261O19]|uniref:NADH dehydrogenase n=1 Tax=candidate division MSBL1 archaeon SCGC-AAA261O19 TaxID=1698277 RepID=A0A133VEL3_9EURY|nr:hypothetical protein AKJ48_01125 [candidate division MSBL1 archaeon SCGC-AAA261O19]